MRSHVQPPIAHPSHTHLTPVSHPSHTRLTPVSHPSHTHVFFSDSILALDKFWGNVPLSKWLVLGTYYAAILLIARCLPADKPVRRKSPRRQQ